jgi:hypothetical protein
MTRPNQPIIKPIIKPVPDPERLRAARQAVTKAAGDVTQGKPLDGLTELILAVDQILKSLEGRSRN